MKGGVNRFCRHVMGLSEFPDTLAGYSPLWQWYWPCSLQGLVTINLLDNFLKLLKIITAYDE